MPTSFKVIPLNAENPYTRLIQPGTDSRVLKSGLVVLQPGESVGEHSTEHKEEILVILAGTASVRVNDEAPVTVSSPAACYIPPQTRHDISNDGDTVLQYVFTVTVV